MYKPLTQEEIAYTDAFLDALYKIWLDKQREKRKHRQLNKIATLAQWQLTLQRN